MSIRPLHWALAGVAIVGGAVLAAGFVVTHDPAPGALVIRAALDAQAADMTKKLAAHDPGGVTELRDQRYGPAADNLLDVYRREGATRPRPTVVWVHGGGWLANDKADAATYFRLLADAGFTVVSVNYSRSPEHRYPTPVREVNAALGYLRQNAGRLGVDPAKFVLAGDSAGAQLAAQVAALTTNPAYARRLGIAPAVKDASELRGVVLDCGVYNLVPYAHRDDSAPEGVLGFAVSQLVWAYAGTTDPESAVFAQMSVIDHVTKAFPAAFITGGNDDPLTASQSRPFAAKLASEGVAVDALFYPADHDPPLPHEYQFDLGTADGQQALKRTIAFLRSVT